MHHLTSALIDYFFDATVNSKGLVAKTDHFSVERQPAISVVLVQRLQNLVIRLHADMFADFEAKNFSWCGAECAGSSWPGLPMSRLLEEIISADPKPVADTSCNNLSI